MIQDELKKWIQDTIVQGLHLDVVDFVVESPSDSKHGDYASNVAMILSKQLKKNPLQIAQDLAEKLNTEKIDIVEKVEAVAPGFINFFLNPEVFGGVVKKIVSEPKEVGKNKKLSGQKISVEYTNTNVLKPFHIGHLLGNVIGEALSHILEESGAEVKRNTYQGDVGLHIAKSLWGIMKLGGKKEGSLHDQVEYIGKAYALGANTYDEDESVQAEIKEINKKVFEKSDETLLDLYAWARQVSLDHFEGLYKKLGTTFDYYFFESEVASDALKIVKEYLAKGVFEESEGAIVFNGKKYNESLHTRVFISSQGIPMYEAKDIAHALRKYATYHFDKAIIITANEQDGYFQVVLEALRQVNPEVGTKTHHLSHGLLRLADGKMSSRKGNVITGESLIHDVEGAVMEKMKDRETTGEVKEKVAEIVAVGALKYSILKQTTGKDIIFDMEKSMSFEGDSGPYLQYSVVRANSILKKAEGVVAMSTTMPDGWQIIVLEKMFEQFGNIVSRSGDEYAPHYIVTYLTELASEFNAFYANNKIIDESDSTSSYKLALTQAFVNIMTKGLDLLGIKVPSEM